MLGGRREVVDHGVEQAVGAQAGGRDAAGDREDVAGVGALLERVDDLVVGDVLALQVALHQRLGVLRDLVHQLLAVLLRLIGEIVRDRDLRARRRRRRTRRPSCRRGRSGRVMLCSAPIGISVATTCGPNASLSESSVRKKSARSRSSMFTKTSRATCSSCARSHRRRVETSTPITPLTTKTADSHTRSAPSASAMKRRLAGGVDQVDLDVAPLERGQRRRDGHAAGLLVLVGIRDRRTVSHRTEPVRRAGLEHQGLVQRRLPAPSVAH